MNCEEIKSRLFDFYEEFGSARPNQVLSGHVAVCKECASFYMQLINDFEKIEKEKQIELSPYLTSKILQKISLPAKSSYTAIWRLKMPVYAASVLLIGIVTGLIINNVALTANEMQIEQTITQDETNEELTVISDNTTLTLNDW